MKAPLQADSGEITPGAWVTMPTSSGGLITGKFSGIYENPAFGTMFYLSHARYHDNAAVKTTVYYFLPKCNDLAVKAQEVKGSLKPGKEPPAPINRTTN